MALPSTAPSIEQRPGLGWRSARDCDESVEGSSDGPKPAQKLKGDNTSCDVHLRVSTHSQTNCNSIWKKQLSKRTAVRYTQGNAFVNASSFPLHSNERVFPTSVTEAAMPAGRGVIKARCYDLHTLHLPGAHAAARDGQTSMTAHKDGRPS